MTDQLPGSAARAALPSAPDGSVLRAILTFTLSFIGARHSMARPLGARAAGRRNSRLRVRVYQAVNMDDEIAHLRIVDRGLGLAPPGRERRRIVGVHADQIELGQVFERDICWRKELAAKDQVEK